MNDNQIITIYHQMLSKHEDHNEIYLHQNEREVVIDAMIECGRVYGKYFAQPHIEAAKKQWLKQIKKALTEIK
jgi:uncharacterized protein YqeY